MLDWYILRSVLSDNSDDDQLLLFYFRAAKQEIMEKKLRLSEEEIKQLIQDTNFCLASDKITVDGLPVGYMYREEPEEDGDSGWCFLSGTEDEDYVENSDNIGIYDVNTIANYDPAVIPYLKLPVGTELERNEDNTFSLLKPE